MRLLREVLLTAAAVGGAVCLLAVLAAWGLGVSLVMFRSGSMEPAIPAGSLALVRQTPAAEVRAGDVVTVDRRGTLPITHRVVGLEPDGTGTVTLTLQGDANAAPDAQTYPVDEVGLVLWSVPHAGFVVGALQRPEVPVLTVAAVATLTTWAFWPPAPGAASGAVSAAGVPPHAAPAGRAASPPRADSSPARGRRRTPRPG